MKAHQRGLVLATALLLAVTACGGNEERTTEGDIGTTSTATDASTGAGERGTLEGAVLPDSAGGAGGTSGTTTTGEVGTGTTTGTAATGTTGGPPQP